MGSGTWIDIGGGGGGDGVTSLNTLTGAITLAAGSNITLTPAGNTITIASSGGGGGVTIGQPVSGGTPNDILFVDPSGNLGQDNSFFFDGSTFSVGTVNVNGQLGAGSGDWGIAVDGGGFFASSAIIFDNNGTLHLSNVIQDNANLTTINPTLRQLVRTDTSPALDWDASILYIDGGPSIDWAAQRLNNKNFSFTTVIDWGLFKLYDQTALNTLDWTLGELYASDHSSSVYKSLNWTDRKLYAGDGISMTLDWDATQLKSTSGYVSLDWTADTLSDGSGVCVGWADKKLYNASGDVTLDWGLYELLAGGIAKINWDGCFCMDSAGINSYDWNARDMSDVNGDIALTWNDRKLYESVASGGAVIMEWSSGLGFFAATPVVKQTGAGAVSAGGTYNATAQNMINAMYVAMQAYGLLT